MALAGARMNAWIAAHRKAIVPALGTVALAVQGITTGGMSGQDFWSTVIGAVVTLLTYQLRNVDPEPVPTTGA